MKEENNEFLDDEIDHPEQHDSKPTASRVDSDKNLEEKDLQRHYLFGKGKMKSVDDPGMEGKGMGGHHFGEHNLTFAGDDEANPSQNAGYDNAYFRRNEPAEEHPEDSNFTPDDEEEVPNIPGPLELPDQQKVGENKPKQAPNPQQEYREGTADNDGQKGDRPKSDVDNSARDAHEE